MELKLTSLAIALMMIHSPLFAQEERSVIAVMNAESYQDDIDVTHYWKSEKLDGIRVIWDGKRLVTRQGHTIHAPSWFTKSLDNTLVEGELWAGRGQFALVQSTVLDQTPNDNAWKQITYMLFDLPQEKGNYPHRYQKLKSLVAQAAVPHIQYVEHSPISSKDALFAYLDQVMQKQGEGVMLRKIDATYQPGRTMDLVKLKRHQDAEAVIVGYKEGTGKYRGMLGSLRVKMSDGKEFYIGSGLSDEQRMNPPAIGSTVTFRYNGYTQHGTPRFTRLVRERMLF